MQYREEEGYHQLLKNIIDGNRYKLDRTNTGTLSLFGQTMRFSLENDTLPIITAKKVFYKKVIGELLWMISGSTSTADLHKYNIHFWDANATREFLDKQGLVNNREGDLGPVYGYQWRHFGYPYKNCDTDYKGKGTDQLVNLIKQIKSNPNSRRHILCAWNAADLNQMALPPCHLLAQFEVYNNELSCILFQRSGDMFLGVPFNITFYSLLTHMIASLCNLKAKEFVHVITDAHIYKNHIEQVNRMLQNEIHPFPKIEINNVKDIDSFTMKDFIVKNYKCGSYIAAPMAV